MNATLSRHATTEGPRWALDGRYLPREFSLSRWLGEPGGDARHALSQLALEGPADAPLMAPVPLPLTVMVFVPGVAGVAVKVETPSLRPSPRSPSAPATTADGPSSPPPRP